MKLLCACAAAVVLVAGPMGFAETVGDCDHPIEAPLRSRGALVIESRPAGVEIVGTDAETIHVSCSVETGHAMDVELRFSGTPSYGRLNITSPVKNQNLHIRIEVPKKTNLRFHMGAGEVKVEDVAGDKDLDLYAGQISINSPSDGAYKSVDASVDIGDVNARAYGVDKGGFFRSFTRTSKDGEYRLRAHVMTGEIDLE
ncbi:MAG TPA: hypothetical protein VHZ25_09525 [Acidobacteriaceae bacterium]|jgi:hypothetical protein|nr:hypothetical protein [Acidobacteriaceae bacterium]